MNKPRSILLLVLVLLSTTLLGCARFRRGSIPDYRTVHTTSARKPTKARRKHDKGFAYMCDCHYALAEQAFQEALIADSSFGPAHNSLGKLYYEQRKYYLAAWEFEHAIKSMPERAEPLNNLGLVYEAVGKLDEAHLQYESAFAIDPENAQYLGNMLRVRIRGGEEPAVMRRELQSLIALDDREDWVRWAKFQLVTDRTDQDWRQPTASYDCLLYTSPSPRD